MCIEIDDFVVVRKSLSSKRTRKIIIKMAKQMRNQREGKKANCHQT
jgi:hypothetical protein